MSLRLYGVEGSQPVRSVLWLLEMKGIPHELVQVMPGSKNGGTRDPAFAARNPTAKVPFLEDDDTGAALAEGAAILAYLANKHGLVDVYPADPKTRAGVDEYLHWHHANTRSISGGFFAPMVRRDLKFPAGVVDMHLAAARGALATFEKRLGKQDFLCGSTPTLADLFAYPELAQCRPECCNLLDFAPFPNIQRWFARMAQLSKPVQRLYGYVRKQVAKANKTAKL